MLAERALNAALNGGCQVPIACHALPSDGELWLRGLVGAVDGSRVLRAEARAPMDQCEALGRNVADQLLAQGAKELLRAVEERQGE